MSPVFCEQLLTRGGGVDDLRGGVACELGGSSGRV